jgi:hypothetical protein
MDDFERHLAGALRAAAPTPPNPIDPRDVTGRSRSRPWAPLLAALAVVAVVVVAFAYDGVGRTHRNTPSVGSVSRSPDDLIGSWNLTDLQGLDGARHTTPDAVLTFTFDRHGRLNEGCATVEVASGAGTIRFVSPWLTTTQAGCPQLGVEPTRFLFSVLTGTARWEIRKGDLTIRRGGDAVVFGRIGGLNAVQRALADGIARRWAWQSPATRSPATRSPATRSPATGAPPASSSTSGANRAVGWPSYVEGASAVVTTRAAAVQYVHAGGGMPDQVLLIRLIGRFGLETKGPAGQPGREVGSVLTLVVDPRTGSVTDFGIERPARPASLPAATVLYPK